jgi:hypothetical protein
MDYTFHDYNDAVAAANAVYDIDCAAANAVNEKACAAFRDNFDEVAFHVRAKACAKAEAVRDSVIAEARARLAGRELEALLRKEKRDDEVIE